MGSFERDLEDDLKYKYNGDRQKQWQDLAKGVAEIEERRENQRKEAICKPFKDQITQIQNRNSELTSKTRQLEQAGDRMAKRLCLIINSERTPDNASIDAVKCWWKAKEESE